MLLPHKTALYNILENEVFIGHMYELFNPFMNFVKSKY